MINTSPDSAKNQFRRRRIQLLKALVTEVLAEKETCSILDIGGTYNFWHVWRDEIEWDRTRITCINRDPEHAADGRGETRVTMLTGDACDLAGIGDNEYDVVFSNSVIEHVGSWQNMLAMASETRRVAPRYLVQTPNFWFPLEPHARTPFLHWLPEPIAYRIVMTRKCGFWQKQTTVSGAVKTVQSARLIDGCQMEALFEDAVLLRERFLGITKSLIAVKGLPSSLHQRARTKAVW